MNYPTIKISELNEHPKNPRNHSEEQIKKIAKSIKELGWGRPIIISKDYYILAGHGAYIAAKDHLKLSEVPYKQMEHLHDSSEALAYMVADNKLTDESDWNYGKLEPLCQELKIEGFDTSLTGFEEKEIQTFPSIIDKIKEVQEDDFDVDSVTESIVQPGQIYQLGNHRLMCGDSTSKEDFQKLMNGELPDMVFTDPPYNVIVLDLFGGSGSTLIACEQTDRKCYMMELDTHYCDVIIKRWEEFTEQKAVLLN